MEDRPRTRYRYMALVNLHFCNNASAPSHTHRAKHPLPLQETQATKRVREIANVLLPFQERSPRKCVQEGVGLEN